MVKVIYILIFVLNDNFEVFTKLIDMLQCFLS